VEVLGKYLVAYYFEHGVTFCGVFNAAFTAYSIYQQSGGRGKKVYKMGTYRSEVGGARSREQ
jgi:hypothetical protein